MNTELFHLLTPEQQDQVREVLFEKVMASVEEIKIKPVDLSRQVKAEIDVWIGENGLPDEVYELVVKQMIQLFKKHLTP